VLTPKPPLEEEEISLAVPDDLASPASTAIVSLPGEIDVTNAPAVQTLITQALAPGVTVVVADLTATGFCDSAGLRHLLLAHRQIAQAGAQLRLAIPPDGPLGRVTELTGINRYVAVYPTLQRAVDGGPPSG
jgi:anti-sigma B factor antagonist